MSKKQEMISHLNNTKNWSLSPAYKNIELKKLTLFQKVKYYISSILTD